MENITLKPSQLTELLTKMIPAGMPVLVKGPPGVGKSDCIDQSAINAKAETIISHPVVSDPTDAKGFPWPKKDGKSATFLPFGDLLLALKAKKRTVWFLDDLGQAPPSVQASFMQLILARRVNGHVLPDCVTFVAATNRRCDRAGVSGILEPVKSRFASIIELIPDLDDWCRWAITNGMPPELIAFLRFRPELLHKFEATSDLTNSPCPRTWASIGKIMGLKFGKHLELAAVAGAVGDGAAAEFISFLRIFRELPSIDGILLDPDSAEIPKNPSALYAVVSALVHKSTVSNFESVIRYCERLTAQGKDDFAVLTIRDAYLKNRKIANTTAFIKMSSTKIGKLVLKS